MVFIEYKDMKFALFANKGFLPYIITHLEKDGHSVLFNNFAPDIDICIVESLLRTLNKLLLSLIRYYKILLSINKYSDLLN